MAEAWRICVCPSAHLGWTGLDQSVLNHSCKPPTRANARIECAPMLAKFNSHDRQRAPRPTWRAIACVRMRSTRPDVCKDLGLCMSPIATCTTPSLRVGVRSHAFERARRRANAFARVRTRSLVMYVPCLTCLPIWFCYTCVSIRPSLRPDRTGLSFYTCVSFYLSSFAHSARPGCKVEMLGRSRELHNHRY